MTGYTKLFGTIVASTIWREEKETKIVWITMLAMANKNGIVEASIPGLADMSRVSLAECKEALVCLEGPDEYSRTKEHEGRRIRPVDGGWEVLNHAKYRAKMNADERREYLTGKQREYRAKTKALDVNTVSTKVNNGSDLSTENTHAEAEAYSETPIVPNGATALPSLGVRKVKMNPETEEGKRVAKLFNRRESTEWSDKEIKAFRKAKVTLEGMDAIEPYYAAERAKGEDGRQRRDLMTFLNNFGGEWDRAKAVQGAQRAPTSDLPPPPNYRRESR